MGFQNLQNTLTNPGAMQQYMNPYLQNALQPQLQEMQRQYDITGTQQQGQATAAGAFGGSRGAIMAAENERNKNMAMNQAIGQGYNQAFQNAQQQAGNVANMGLQGYQAAGQAGSALANIGAGQLASQQSILGAQNQAGAQQQAQQQPVDQKLYQTANHLLNVPAGEREAFLSSLSQTDRSAIINMMNEINNKKQSQEKLHQAGKTKVDMRPMPEQKPPQRQSMKS